MSKGSFLANPALHPATVDVSATSELGRRGGDAVAFEGGSGLLEVSIVGDAGDGTDRDFVIKGTQKRPLYSPKTTAGAEQFTAPETFATLGALSSLDAGAKISLAVAEDRLYAFVAHGNLLVAYRWSGSDWSVRASIDGVTDHSAGISAAAAGENVYVAVGDGAAGEINVYRFNAPTDTLGLVAEAAVTTADTLESLAFASSGTLFVLLLGIEAGGDRDVEVWIGGTAVEFERNADTIGDLFGSDWTSGGQIRSPAISWNQSLGFVAAFRTKTTDPAHLRLATAEDGLAWIEFENKGGNVDQPTVSSSWGDALSCAIALESYRVFVYRAISGAQDDPPTGVVMQWFDGKTTWSAEIDADGGAAVDAATQISAREWRGTMYVGWRDTAATAVVRKNNELTTTDTGYYREMKLGEPNYLAGPEDDTQTALFFIPTGSVRPADSFRVPAGEYDFPAKHLLSPFMSQVWRGEQGAEQTIVFDAGENHAFALDALALFRTNFPEVVVEVDDDEAFPAPSLSETLSATIVEAAVVGADRDRVTFAAATFAEREHALTARWVKFSAGTSEIFRILDNTANALIVDGDATAASGTATIFGDRIEGPFDQVYEGRYLRLIIAAVEVPDGYYTAAFALFGCRFAPSRNFSNAFTRVDEPIDSVVQLRSGSRYVTGLNLEQRAVFALSWDVVDMAKHLLPLKGFHALSYGRQYLVAFWSGRPGEASVYIGRITEFTGRQINKNFYSVESMRFESEV